MTYKAGLVHTWDGFCPLPPRVPGGPADCTGTSESQGARHPEKTRYGRAAPAACGNAASPGSHIPLGKQAERLDGSSTTSRHDEVPSHCRKAKVSEARGPAPGSARGWFQPELRQHPVHPGLGPQGHRGEGDFGWLWPPCSLGTQAPTTRQASTQRHKRRRLAVWGINSRVRECSPMKGLGPLAQVTSKAVAVTPPGSVVLPPKPPVTSCRCPECG